MTNKTFGSSAGLTILAEDQATPANGMVAHVTSSWNSGYQPGDIKGAFLSDTSTDALAATEYAVDGAFDNGANWNLFNATIAGGVLSLDGSGGLTSYALDDGNGIVAGKFYEYSFDVVSVTAAGGGVRLRVGGAGFTPLVSAPGTYSGIVVASGVDRILVDGRENFVGTIDNVSVKLADADRSVNANGLIVNGTITRSPVAPGADLVAYSGFSATNYLEQPYNPDLDFGTGDFCYMGWLSDFDNWRTVLWRGTDAATSFVIDPVGTTTNARINVGGSPITTPCVHWTNDWRHMAVLRASGIVSIYVNGVLQSSFSAVNNNLTLADATLRFGEQSSISGSGTYSQGSLALWRISATAPTPDQIRKIYEDERPLFQENAKCTLYGTSDTVTALAHDPVTGLDHVGTNQGRSDFQRLLRVSNTTTPVGTAISAVNGMIAED